LLARDLENLPQFLCRQDDIVLTNQKPGVEFLSGIKQAGFRCRNLSRSTTRAVSNLASSAVCVRGRGGRIALNY